MTDFNKIGQTLDRFRNPENVRRWMDTCHLRKVNWLAFLTWLSCLLLHQTPGQKKNNNNKMKCCWWSLSLNLVGKWLFHSKDSCVYRFPCYKIKQVIYDSPFLSMQKVKWKKVVLTSTDFYPTIKEILNGSSVWLC